MDEQEQQDRGAPTEGRLDIEFGDYRLLERVGEGGMAVTYKAHERVSSYAERLVCIKQILPQFSADPKFREMFHDEVRITSLLSHRNVCRIFRAGEVDGKLYMAMEFIDGPSVADLRDIVRARGQVFPVEHALYLCAEVMEGLHAAHTQTDTLGRELKLVHRDISPQNVLVSRSGDVKVIDFGVAKAASNMARTRTGAVKGKLLYLSPEQLQAAELDGRSDVFSAGMMLYELLTDTHPFEGPDEHSTLFNYIAREIERPSRVVDHLPPELDEVVMRAVAKERDLRYATAADMARALTDALYHLAPSYRPYRFAEFVAWALDDEAGPVPRVQTPSAFAQTGAGLASPTTDPNLHVAGGHSGASDWQGQVEFAPTLATEAVPVRQDLLESPANSEPASSTHSSPELAPPLRTRAPGASTTSTLEPARKPPWALFALIAVAVLAVAVTLGLILGGGDDDATLGGSAQGAEETPDEPPSDDPDPATTPGATAGLTPTPPDTPGTDGTTDDTLPAEPDDGTGGVAGLDADDTPPGTAAPDPPDDETPDDDDGLGGWGGATTGDDADPVDTDELDDLDDGGLGGWANGGTGALDELGAVDETDDSVWGGGRPGSGSAVQVIIDGERIDSYDDLDGIELSGTASESWEMTLQYMAGVKGTRLATFYKVTMYASEDQAAMLPLLQIFCARIAEEPWTEDELAVIDKHMAGYDPCAWVNP